MLKHNPKNERIKRQYVTYLREAKRQSEASLDAVTAALARFEMQAGYRDFRYFHHKQAIAFKNYLAGEESQVSGEKLSKATQYATLSHLKRFFQWLAMQPGYKSSVQYSDSEYFNLPDKDARIATARRHKSVPTLEQVKHTISFMPFESDIEKRNRALVAFALLTGARDSAIASLKLKHLDLEAGCVDQDAREVNTKFSKTFTTYFFPVGDEILKIVADWVAFLRHERLWGNDDPLFPKTRTAVGPNQQFVAAGLERSHWRNATPIRQIFRAAYIAAKLPYFNPHSLRSTLASLGETLCPTPEAFKAWSQNLGHEGVLTTFYSYGAVANHRQAEIIRQLGKPPTTSGMSWEELLRALQRELGTATA